MADRISFPASTGQVARFIGTTEPILADTVRRGRVKPEPPIVAGRRLWGPEHLIQAARALDLLTDELREALGSTTGAGVAGGEP